MGHEMYPATRTAATVCGSFIRKIRHYGEPHPFAPTGEQVNNPLRALSQSPVLWMGILYSDKLLRRTCAFGFRLHQDFDGTRRRGYPPQLPPSLQLRRDKSGRHHAVAQRAFRIHPRACPWSSAKADKEIFEGPHVRNPGPLGQNPLH